MEITSAQTKHWSASNAGSCWDIAQESDVQAASSTYRDRLRRPLGRYKAQNATNFIKLINYGHLHFV